MSSETSTEPQPAFEPWQLFTLAGLIGATIAVFMARGESPAAVIMISLTIFAAAGVGIAALRTFLPLTQKTWSDGARILGGRTRAALEREKALVLRSIKELEFDRAMGKVSDKDFTEMSGRLRARAARLIRQLDAGAGYRTEIEREIAKRIGVAPGGAKEPDHTGSIKQDPAYGTKEQDPAYGTKNQDPAYGTKSQDLADKTTRQDPADGTTEEDPAYGTEQQSHEDAGRVLLSRTAACTSCNTANDADARFCKHCGQALEVR